jgi:hypothetical protein
MEMENSRSLFLCKLGAKRTKCSGAARRFQRLMDERKYGGFLSSSSDTQDDKCTILLDYGNLNKYQGIHVA